MDLKRKMKEMGKYKVTINIDAMVNVVVDANSPQEAFDNASLADARITSIDDLDVLTSEPFGCEDVTGNYTEYKA